MIFFHALSGVFSLLVVGILGYILTVRGKVPTECRKILPKLVTNISLPPFLAYTILTSFPAEELHHLIYLALIPFALMFFLFFLGYVTGKLLKVNSSHFGLFCACISNPNTIFIGIPVNQALFGDASLPYVLLYYFASTSFFWTFGNYFIARDRPQKETVQNVCQGSAFKNIQWNRLISPPLTGFLTGILLLIFEIKLPVAILRPMKLIGDLTTPLALLYIGIMLAEFGIRKLRFTRDISVALIGRIVVSPLLMALVLYFLPLPVLMKNVFIMQSSLPVLMQVAILSAYYNTDPFFGTEMVAISTILCIITIPIYMCLI